MNDALSSPFRATAVTDDTDMECLLAQTSELMKEMGEVSDDEDSSPPPEISALDVKLEEQQEIADIRRGSVDSTIRNTRPIKTESDEYRNGLYSSPLRTAQRDYTLTRNVKRKLEDSAPSPISAPATTGRRSPFAHRSPALGLNTPAVSMMSTPTDLRYASPMNYHNEVKMEPASDTGSLERRVSHLNIAPPDRPAMNNSNSSPSIVQRKNSYLGSPPRQQHTPSPSSSVPLQQSQKVENKFVMPTVTPKMMRHAQPIPQSTSFADYNQQEFQNAEAPKPPCANDHMRINQFEYTILKEIGRGSSGKVYQVLSHNHSQIYALKWIEVKRKEDLQSIINEIELLRDLRHHDNIITLCDYRTTPSVIWMVMEFGEIDLAHLIQKQSQKEWDITFIRYYWKQMLQSVYAIHQKHIVHSDLKPANFVLVRGCLKLIDFGIAKRVPDDTTNIERIVQVGTINYMSPEALLDINEGRDGDSLMKLGRASDVWSLGCILYQMVYGKTPFYHLQLTQKVASIPNPNYPIAFPSTIQHCDKEIQLPGMLVTMLQHCLNRNPVLRPPMTELLAHPFVNT